MTRSTVNHRQLVLPYLFNNQRVVEGGGQELGGVVQHLVQHEVQQRNQQTNINPFATTNSPHTILAEYPGRCCNVCHADCSCSSLSIRMCTYCDKVSCCIENCGICENVFCKFCVSSTYLVGRGEDVVCCRDCGEEEEWNRVRRERERDEIAIGDGGGGDDDMVMS